MQTAIADNTTEDIAVQQSRGFSDVIMISNYSSDEEAEASDADETEMIEFTGTKCRAPYTHTWGEMSFHNAIISSILAEQSQV